MASNDIRSNVQRAITSEWPAFERSHPKLAAVIDEDLIVNAALEKLSDDPDYQEAIADAVAMGTAGSVMSDFVERFVKRWLKDLV